MLCQCAFGDVHNADVLLLCCCHMLDSLTHAYKCTVWCPLPLWQCCHSLPSPSMTNLACVMLVSPFLQTSSQCTALSVCREVLRDPTENPMVRHEAAEALGAIAAPECLQLLQEVR